MKTIEELVVKVVAVENEKRVSEKRRYNAEEKKNLVDTFKLLFEKDELEEGLRFCFKRLSDDWDISSEAAYDCGEKDNWTPQKSMFYTITNMLMYCLDIKTFKQVGDDWFPLYTQVSERLFW